MKNHFPKIRLFIFLSAFLVLHLFIINNALLLARDMVYGDFSLQKVSPAPRLKARRLQIRKFQAVNRLGIDFAQVYFPSKQFSSLEVNYSTGDGDPLKRPSRYAPLVHYLCAISICNMNYGWAALTHMFIQIALFYFSLLASIYILNIKRYTLPILTLVNFFLFLTPVGISWFERGQFSLYVASAYLWLILGLHKRCLWLLVLSACFAFVKWTSLPFFFVVLVMNVLANLRDSKGFRHAIVSAMVVAAVFVLFSIPFFNQTRVYLLGLYQQELTFDPNGISLMILLPRALVKATPFGLVILGWLAFRRLKHLDLLMPFFTGTAILLIIYPTIAVDYSVPVLMGFIPLLLAWMYQPITSAQGTKAITLLFFFLFLVAASFSRDFQNLIPVNNVVIISYVVISLVLICISLTFPPANNNRASLG